MAVVLVAIGLAATGTAENAGGPTFAGAVLVVLTTTAALVVPWRRLPRAATAAVPVANIVAVTLFMSDDLLVSPLLVLPVLWLARSFPSRGVVPAVVLGAMSPWVAETALALKHDTVITIDQSSLQRLVIVPTVLVTVALVAAAAERRGTARLALVAGQSQLVEESLTRTRTQRRLFEAVLNTIDVGVVAIDADGNLVLINRAMVDQESPILGVDGPVADPQVLAHTPGRILAADGTRALPVEERPLVRAHRGELIERELVWWEREDGRRTAQRVSAAQLRGEDGERAGAVLVYQDLTTEMEALAQREEFVSSVSHELRTPLTSILGYLDLARDEPDLPEAAHHHLSVAGRNAERLELLITNLLAAARSRAADTLPVEEVDLSSVVEDVVEGQQPRADSAEVTLVVDVDGPCVVRAGRLRLTQVVDNVVSNAVKYSRPGGRVEIRSWCADDGVHLRVTDEGIGISEADQAKLFNRFYRAPAVRQGPVQGTGLGLHITKQIVEVLGGTIALDSELGVGSTLSLTLPSGGPR